MSWDELIEQVNKMTPEQRARDVTIFVSGVGEYYPPVSDFPLVESDESTDVLDPGSFYIVI